MSSGKHPPGYFRRYYLEHREKIIAQISEQRRRRKAATRARLTEAGLLPLPPSYRESQKDKARINRFVRRVLAMDDVYVEEEDPAGPPAEEGDRPQHLAPE